MIVRVLDGMSSISQPYVCERPIGGHKSQHCSHEVENPWGFGPIVTSSEEDNVCSLRPCQLSHKCGV